MQPSRDKLVISLCGVPASGKSILARLLCPALCGNLRQRTQSFTPEAYVVSFDEEQQAIYESKSITILDSWRASRIASFDKLQQILGADPKVQPQSQLFKWSRVVVVDDTSHLRSMRRQLRSIAASKGAHFISFLVDVDLDTAILRNTQRIGAERVSDKSIQKIHDSMEVPGPEARWTEWERQSLCVLDGSRSRLSVLAQALRALLELSPVAPPRDKSTCSSSMVLKPPSSAVAQRATILRELDEVLRLAVRDCVKRAIRASAAAGPGGGDSRGAALQPKGLDSLYSTCGRSIGKVLSEARAWAQARGRAVLVKTAEDSVGESTERTPGSSAVGEYAVPTQIDSSASDCGRASDRGFSRQGLQVVARKVLLATAQGIFETRLSAVPGQAQKEPQVDSAGLRLVLMLQRHASE